MISLVMVVVILVGRGCDSDRGVGNYKRVKAKTKSGDDCADQTYC